jgi:hypothetical protein
MSVSKKRRARALRAFVERLTKWCQCHACFYWRKGADNAPCERVRG